MDYRIYPPEDMLQMRVATPPSKSIINRLLIINALTAGTPATPDTDTCEDTRLMAAALAADVTGAETATVNIGPCGTAMRFLTAYYASTEGANVILDGSERMRRRPIGVLVDALRELGADIEYAGQEGFPPLRIRGRKLTGGSITIDPSVSSQYISALLMAAPTMTEGLTLTLHGWVTSLPYIKLTLGLMERHGIDCDMDRESVNVRPGDYVAVEGEKVESDWSAASYWYEISALSAGFVTLDGLQRDSLQGDSAVAAIFEQLGVNTDYEGEEGGFDLLPSPDQMPRLVLDLQDYPDLVPAIVVTAAMLGIPFRLSGLQSLRIKESDRVAALMAELRKLGILTEWDGAALTWELKRMPIHELPQFDTYADHRMAMALAPVAVFVPGIVVKDVEVVEKSYPDYWRNLEEAGFRLVDAATEEGADDDADDIEYGTTTTNPGTDPLAL